MYTMPTIDFSAKSLLGLSQLGFFLCFAYWFGEATETNSGYIFSAFFVASGLALFLSVPNSRMGVTLGVPGLMIVMGLATGENEMLFWSIFMLVMFGPVAYIPALATGDPTLGLEEDDAAKRLGVAWVLFSLLMIFMMSSIVPFAMDGEYAEESFDGIEYEMTLDSTQQTIAQVGLAVGVLGTLVFILTAFGVELGPMLSWHGGAMTAASLAIGQLLWLTSDGVMPYNIVAEVVFILSLVGITSLPPCIANRNS